MNDNDNKNKNKNPNHDDLVLLEDEKALLLNHNYDGIRELNNPLPRWWLIIFYGTIVFSIGYYAYYTFLGGPTLMDEYQTDIAKIEAAKSEWMKTNAPGFNEEKFNAAIASEDNMKLASKTFKRKCAPCHAEDGGGIVGPNLTDSYWIHGKGDAASIYNVIDQGVPDKGMEPWGQSLTPEVMLALTQIVMNLKGTTPANPKEAQGELVE